MKEYSEVLVGKLEETNSEFAGMGLGLYIAKKYGDLLGGTLTVESREGEGSTFMLRLPGES